MEHAIVTTDKGREIKFWEAALAQIGGTVEVELYDGAEVWETQTIVSVKKCED